MDRSVADAIARLSRAGIVVAIASQSVHGRVDIARYARARRIVITRVAVVGRHCLVEVGGG